MPRFVQVLPLDQARLLYPWSSAAEPRPPKPSTNAMSRLVHMDMVMDMQAGLE